MQSSMDANEEGFLNCARYGLMLAERIEDDATRANLIKLVRAWLTAAKEIEKAGSKDIRPAMTHEGIEYVIRVGIGRNEWALLIYYPDKADGKPVVAKFTGTREAANAVARRKIDNCLKEQKRKARSASSST
jgi:hypothetical protein